ncbi:hypothetical protein TREMEDRAFT_61433 [Tremella mesenterica DSM 1558]|uniref:uncharacterized protein n=1 Tax=Tremella mesenterica (strain ATCC 24925 / CBS 8224 / DSM 1558 / NBRC 9311 / NRRL Y-6157 / RJB 2259-6 / UBC 559-6) TaxID=578456 RepID=UPI0003F499DB|nr:uncharacterized protein TREMEDRAFT_61433 [Tremella mesenterica DSM 1558]EIW70922.1 hypothetical protein TREMEDRAFT_61433 [Tremella mesenterica DSM 1558]
MVLPKSILALLPLLVFLGTTTAAPVKVNDQNLKVRQRPPTYRISRRNLYANALVAKAPVEQLRSQEHADQDDPSIQGLVMRKLEKPNVHIERNTASENDGDDVVDLFKRSDVLDEVLPELDDAPFDFLARDDGTSALYRRSADVASALKRRKIIFPDHVERVLDPVKFEVDRQKSDTINARNLGSEQSSDNPMIARDGDIVYAYKRSIQLDEVKLDDDLRPLSSFYKRSSEDDPDTDLLIVGLKKSEIPTTLEEDELVVPLYAKRSGEVVANEEQNDDIFFFARYPPGVYDKRDFQMREEDTVFAGLKRASSAEVDANYSEQVSEDYVQQILHYHARSTAVDTLSVTPTIPTFQICFTQPHPTRKGEVGTVFKRVSNNEDVEDTALPLTTDVEDNIIPWNVPMLHSSADENEATNVKRLYIPLRYEHEPTQDDVEQLGKRSKVESFPFPLLDSAGQKTKRDEASIDSINFKAKAKRSIPNGELGSFNY